MKITRLGGEDNVPIENSFTSAQRLLRHLSGVENKPGCISEKLIRKMKRQKISLVSVTVFSSGDNNLSVKVTPFM